MKPITKPTILFVRHGETSMRGWNNPPLTNEGVKEAHKAAEQLAPYPLHHIYAGDLARTAKTAQIISKKTGVAFTKTQKLRPWDYGKLTGETINDASLKALRYYQEHPNKPVPRGESYADFYKRFSSAVQSMKKYVQDHPEAALVAVTHSRNLYPLPHILGDTSKPIPVHEKSEAPGSVWKVEFAKDGKFKMSKL
jgi:broad specificity phosphatase PhoE